MSARDDRYHGQLHAAFDGDDLVCRHCPQTFPYDADASGAEAFAAAGVHARDKHGLVE